MESKGVGRRSFKAGALVTFFKISRKKSETVQSGENSKELARKVIKRLGHVMTRNSALCKINKPAKEIFQTPVLYTEAQEMQTVPFLLVILIQSHLSPYSKLHKCPQSIY